MKAKSTSIRMQGFSGLFAPLFLSALLIGLGGVLPVRGALHLWGINEVYSNADGSVQFVEFFSASAGQEFIEGSNLIAEKQDGSDSNTFTFPSNSPAPTGNKSLLMATPGFADVPGGVEPDFTIPEGFLFTESASVTFDGSTLDNRTVSYDTLPTDGVKSLGPDGVNDMNSPQNFAGEEGQLNLGGTPLTVTITSPESGATFSMTETVTIVAEASGGDGDISQVEFFDGETSLGTDSESPYELDAELQGAGEHTLTAEATDDQGATATSDPVTITLEAPEPAESVEITSVSSAEGNLSLEWEGGSGPFALQQKTTLSDEVWTDVAVTEMGNASVSQVSPHRFFRVADRGEVSPIPMTAHLSGAFQQQEEPVETEGRGSATLVLEGNRLTFNIEYSQLTDAATAAHIHGPADTTTNAGVMISLVPFAVDGFGESGAIAGSVAVTPEQRQALLNSRTYINIHTETYPGGEIRGQVAPIAMGNQLTGEAEVHDVTTDGSGTAKFALVGNRLAFNITYADLTGPANAAHIHGPASEGEDATVMVGLGDFTGDGFGVSGSLQGSVTLEPEQLQAVIDGRTYVNIHTEQHGAGELRAQILPRSGVVPMTTTMSSAFEQHDVTGGDDASGSGTFLLDGDTLSFDIHYSGLSGPASAAHIHGPAPALGDAGVMIGLGDFNGDGFDVSGTLSGEVTLTPEQRAAVLDGKTYVNIHTEQNGAGEIRGQIHPVLMKTSLSGSNQQPDPVETGGHGFGLFTLVQDRLAFNLTYGGLTGPAVAAHIHAPAPENDNAGVEIGLEDFNGPGFGVFGSLAGTTEATPEQLQWIIDGMSYVNIHTEQNQPGEIRGQIRR